MTMGTLFSIMHHHSLWPSSITWTGLLWSYASAEIIFHLIYTFYLVPRANKRTQPRQYRDYGTDRHRLLVRILDRMKRTCEGCNADFYEYLDEFLSQWFRHEYHRDPTTTTTRPFLTRLSSSLIAACDEETTTSSSPEISSDEEEDDNDSSCSSRRTTLSTLRRQNVDELLSWALFGKNHDELLQWENDELAYIYRLMHERYDITFAEGNDPHKVPRRLTLEDVSPWHRPLLVYALVYGFNTLGGALWRLFGFRRYTTTNGLIYWHSAPQNATASTNSRLPLLFFHGIAPGGLTVYLPMLLFGLGCKQRNRHVFLFENPPIACQLVFDALSEDETVEGVVEALDRHLLQQDGEKATSPVALCGHSFGSCPLTWLLASPKMRPRIRQLVLVDPVTILLSEPDVMNNFLYSRQEPAKEELPSINTSFLSRLIAWWRRSKIHIVASSELCTEHYLRRHFSWYNSELWLEDIPSCVQVLVCLSEGDEIIHSRKVIKEIELYKSKKKELTNVQVLLWKGVGHAHCLMSSQNWEEIVCAMDQQEGHVRKVKTT